MENIPNDGSYFLGNCDAAGCMQGQLVRKLRLDRLEEGATVHLCKKHWELEMKYRKWQNKYVSTKWDIYWFFHPDPQHEDLDRQLYMELSGRHEWSDDFILWNLGGKSAVVQMFVATINGGADGHRNTANWKQNVFFDDVEDEIDAILQSFSNDERVVVITLGNDLPFKSARTFAQDIADYELALYDLNRRRKTIERGKELREQAAKDEPPDVQMRMMDLSTGADCESFDVWYAYPQAAVFYGANIKRKNLQGHLDELEKTCRKLGRFNVLYVLFDATKDQNVIADRRKAVARLWLEEDFKDA